MKRLKIGFIISIFLLSSIFFVGIVNARGGTFVIEPLEEANERVELKAGDEVHGNFSISSGFIDFHIVSPSGTVILCYNKTEFNVFNFTAEEDGNYTIHLFNTCQVENVSVTLNYVIDFKITLQMEVGVGYSTGSAVVIGAPPPRIDWLWEILKIIVSTMPGLIEVLLKFFRWIRWKMKYGKRRTPYIVIKLSSRKVFESLNAI